MIRIYKFSFAFLLLFITHFGYSQTGMNTKTVHTSAALQIDAKSNNAGVLIPSLTTAQKLAIVNPAVSLLVYDSDTKCISQNRGTEAVPKWDCLTAGSNKQFFYMPSMNISTKTLGAASVDLFNRYLTEFTTPKFKSPLAPTSIPTYKNATDLYYYVTYADPTLITINSISNAGVMSYNVLRKADQDDFINIVFVVK